MARKKEQKDLLEYFIESGLLRNAKDPELGVRFIPWGIEELDQIIGGGAPRGRITVLVGEFSSGKTFLLQTLIKNAIEQGLKVVYIDTERSYDPAWWERVGVDLEKLFVAQPASGEEAADIADAAVRSGYDLLAVDSIAGLIPKVMLEEKTEQQFVGLQARMIQRFIQKVLSNNTNTALVFTNQFRSVLTPGPIDNMPGGNALRYFAHVILRVQREGWIEENGERVGFYIRVICRKSKVSKSGGEVLLPFYFRGEIDKIVMLFDRAIEYGVIKQKGPWYEVPWSVNNGTEDKILGRNTVIEAIKANPELVQQLRFAVEAMLEKH